MVGVMGGWRLGYRVLGICFRVGYQYLFLAGATGVGYPATCVLYLFSALCSVPGGEYTTGYPSQADTKNESPHLPNIEVGGEGNDYALRTFSKN